VSSTDHGACPGATILVAAQDAKPGIKVVKVNGRLPGEAGYRKQ
jgi:hypothetical protein